MPIQIKLVINTSHKEYPSFRFFTCEFYQHSKRKEFQFSETLHTSQLISQSQCYPDAEKRQKQQKIRKLQISCHEI